LLLLLIFLFFSSTTLKNLGAEKLFGEVSPTSIFITWFSGKIENDINQTAEENKII
jgi:hypothetical protein